MTAPGALTTDDPMLATVEGSATQWAQAVRLAERARVPTGPHRAVVVAGMGGSGVAGDVAALVAARGAAVPVMAVHGPELPAFVDDRDLVVLVSHSGGTAETLACARQAVAAGADLVAVTAGGELAARVEAADGTVVRVPDDAPPRASVALLTVPVLAALEGSGALPACLDDCRRIPGALEPLVTRWRDVGGAHAAGGDPSGDGDSAGATEPEPLALARAMGPGAPTFLGVDAVTGVVASRARNQIAENAKRPASAAELPEADHNELVGWAGRGAGQAELVVLRPVSEPPDIARRAQATLELAGHGFAAVHEHRLGADGVLPAIAAGFLFVDLLSVHLALLDGVAPTPVTAIDELKRRL